MFSPEILHAVQLLSDLCVQRQIRIVTAESCTGGLIAAALTAVAGSSRVVDGGFVTYSNEAKMAELAVSLELIEQHGAVSQEVAQAMASGALSKSKGRAELAIAVTGVAGPGGGTPGKPVGRVHIAVAIRDTEHVHHEKHGFVGMSRSAVREQTVLAALRLAVNCCR